MVSKTNNLVYRSHRHPRVKMMVVHLERLAPYLGAAQDNQPQEGSRGMRGNGGGEGVHTVWLVHASHLIKTSRFLLSGIFRTVSKLEQ
jgi:hypothetical protein